MTTYPDLLEKLMSEGWPFQVFCSRVGIARSTFFEWRKKIPEFAAAFERGKMHKDKHYFELLQQLLMEGKKVNPKVLDYLMQHAAGFRVTQEPADYIQQKISEQTQERIKHWQEKYKSDV